MIPFCWTVSHIYSVSLETLGSRLEFKFCESEQCLAAQHVFVMTCSQGVGEVY